VAAFLPWNASGSASFLGGRGVFLSGPARLLVTALLSRAPAMMGRSSLRVTSDPESASPGASLGPPTASLLRFFRGRRSTCTRNSGVGQRTRQTSFSTKTGATPTRGQRFHFSGMQTHDAHGQAICRPFVLTCMAVAFRRYVHLQVARRC
jgi:hypothetical protein